MCDPPWRPVFVGGSVAGVVAVAFVVFDEEQAAVAVDAVAIGAVDEAVIALADCGIDISSSSSVNRRN